MADSLTTLGLSLLVIFWGTSATPLPTQEELGWTCQRDLRGPGDRVLYVRKELTLTGKHIVYTAGFRSSSDAQEDTSLFWIFKPSDHWADALDTAHFTFAFPAPQKGPVFAKVFRNGVFIARQRIFDADWIEKNRGAARFQGSLDFSTPATVTQLRLHGTSDLTAVITGPDGQELAHPRFLLPDWRRADRFIKRAIADLDHAALDYSTRCGQQSGDPSD